MYQIFRDQLYLRGYSIPIPLALRVVARPMTTWLDEELFPEIYVYLLASDANEYKLHLERPPGGACTLSSLLAVATLILEDANLS
jgi:hypothetical protein